MYKRQGQIPYEELERVMALVFPEDFSVDSGHFSNNPSTLGAAVSRPSSSSPSGTGPNLSLIHI